MDSPERYVQLCPQCGSKEVHIDFSNPAVWSYGTAVNYVCIKCGHRGRVFPEVRKSKVNEYKKNVRRMVTERPKKTIDSTTGFFAARIELIAILCFYGTLLVFIGISLGQERAIFKIFIGVGGIMALLGICWYSKAKMNRI